ncbi:MAG TPA: HD domain-containing phosphohydrolase, partial [Calditrichia bacterium]|nr:HD domain-containing phosphohydrolase [Calditrichia bacterium]
MDGVQHYSKNDRLNKLLDRVVKEVRLFAEGQIRRVDRLAQVGIALSAEKDIARLLEKIVDEAMGLTHADAGTLYTVDEEHQQLRFEIMKNISMDIHLGGSSGKEVALPPVPLFKDDSPNYTNVSSFVGLTGEIVNIPDVYDVDKFDFTGPRKYDSQTGYRTRSMLVIPMKNHENDIIGVLQLLNAIDPASGQPTVFAEEYVDLCAALASQAAIALENVKLIADLKELFEALIKVIATAIDEKSPYTAGHITRVTDLTMMIARTINETGEGPFSAVNFSRDELEELRIAAWMHDVGKITTPEHVIDKSHKLQTVFDRIELVSTRFQLIRQVAENEFLQLRLDAAENPGANLKKAEVRHRDRLAQIDEDLAFLVSINTGREFLDDASLERLTEIAARTYSVGGKTYPYLTENELQNLSVRRGTLTPQERKVIENHALVSIKILKQLPFPKKMSRVPEYAGGHHEKLDGSGYPFGLTAEQLPLQARIMALADIFEALTAHDRPYKKPMKLSRAVQILASMCEQNHIDK